MSRAFVRESDQGTAESLPRRAVSAHPNLVTPNGLALLEAKVRELEEARSAAKLADDRATLAHLTRDALYFAQRLASARVIEPAAAPAVVRFGVQVVLAESDGSERTFRLVGEDEADPAHGLLSWVSPLAQALIGREPGDTITLQGRELEIVRLEG